MGPTHVFNNPIAVLLNGLISLLRGENSVEFLWHDETVKYEWKLTRNFEQKHKVNVSITECAKIQNLEFEVKLKFFYLCVLKQM